jgi:hypothetical protein
VLASANTSIFSIGTMPPQQITHIPKTIQTRQMNASDLNISMHKVQAGQSPTLRQEAAQHALIQNNAMSGRRTLAMSSKVASGANVS